MQWDTRRWVKTGCRATMKGGSNTSGKGDRASSDTFSAEGMDAKGQGTHWESGKASTGAGSGHSRGTKLGRQAVRTPSSTARRLGSRPGGEGSQLFPPIAAQVKATEAPENLLTVQTLGPGPGEPGSAGLGHSPEVSF